MKNNIIIVIIIIIRKVPKYWRNGNAIMLIKLNSN
jgi:hypothetical protein